jgi:hypothetical protein
VLLHALTLWELPDGASAAPGPEDHGFDPAEQVRQWLALPDGVPQHPFVEAAAELCVWALITRRPDRFLWIDESGVSAHVGSQTAGDGEVRKHQLWIPPSTGWSTLHPRAQQLLADVMLLLNLAGRGDWPKDRLRRLHRTARPDLPPCLTKDRRPLDPGRSLVRTAAAYAGSNCRDDCAFELCPYPPSGLDGYRPELSEAFCRGQLTLLSRSRWRSLARPEARWQRGTDLAELRLFWERMAKLPGGAVRRRQRPRGLPCAPVTVLRSGVSASSVTVSARSRMPCVPKGVTEASACAASRRPSSSVTSLPSAIRKGTGPVRVHRAATVASAGARRTRTSCHRPARRTRAV